MTLGEELRTLRLANDLTASHASRMIGKHKRTVGKFERDELTPRLITLKALADVYGVAVEPLAALLPHRLDRPRLAPIRVAPTPANEKGLSRRERGHLHGQKWSAQSGMKTRVFRIRQLKDELSDDWNAWFTDHSAEPAAERLFYVIEPGEDGRREAAEAFWRKSCGLAQYGDYVQGFAEGGLRIVGPTVANVTPTGERSTPNFIHPHHDGNRDAAAKLWRDRLSIEATNKAKAAFVRGFAEGATA